MSIKVKVCGSMIMAPWSGSGILKILDDNLCDVVNNFNNNACSYKFILGGREGERDILMLVYKRGASPWS